MVFMRAREWLPPSTPCRLTAPTRSRRCSTRMRRSFGYWAARLALFLRAQVWIDKLRKLASDRDHLVRRAAVEAIGALGTTADVDVIVDLFVDPVPVVRAHAVRAAAAFSTPTVLAAVRGLLDDHAWMVRAAASDVLTIQARTCCLGFNYEHLFTRDVCLVVLRCVSRVPHDARRHVCLDDGIATRENRLRAREARLEDFDTLLTSPFTIPVSIIAPAFNEEVGIYGSVRSLLALDYPEYEVIVVNDGSRDGTLTELAKDFDLEVVEAKAKPSLSASAIRGVYRSRSYPRLTVIDKVNGGKADALNCGINFARFRYICCVDTDTVYYQTALLKGMRLIVQDPATVVGVTSQVALSRHPERTAVSDRRIDRHPLIAYQTFDYLRAFVAARLAWSAGNYMLCSVGAFAIWRRDVVLELQGFSRSFTCEDIEFTFRVHRHFRKTGTPYRVHSLTDPVGVTEGPQSIRSLVSQRARWQRVIAETVWSYRGMLCNPRYGTVGCVGMPYYVTAEVLAPSSSCWP